MNLTPNFTLEELTHTDHREFDNMPDADELANLYRLADFLEQVKIVLGNKPIMIKRRSKQGCWIVRQVAAPPWLRG